MAVLTRARGLALAGVTTLAVVAPLTPVAPVSQAAAVPVAQATTISASSAALAVDSSFAVRSARVMRIGNRLKGVPYVYGGSTPRGFDCSGFTMYVYRKVGMQLTHSATAQMHKARKISRARARKGDLVFFRSGSRAYHVGIYAGRNRVLHAPRPGKRVERARIWTHNVTFGRVL